MAGRRLVGIDLGIATAHTVRVLREDGGEVWRGRCSPRLDSLEEVERAALGDSEASLEMVIEPTGPAWLPVAVFFASRGHTVYRVSSAKAAALRRFFSRHAKSNGIDAETLARLPLVDPGGLQPLQLPEGARASLDRRVRVCNRLTRQAGEHKTRIKDLVRQLLPESPLRGGLRKADLAVLERTGADPRLLLAMGKARLSRMIAKASVGHLDGEERAETWLDAARSALELFGDHPTLAYEDRAAEIITEVRLVQALEAELSAHETAREAVYLQVDAGELARSLPGIAEVCGATVVSWLGEVERFARSGQVRSFAGLAPRASETGESDRKGQPMSKAGPQDLRTALMWAADNARQIDPQFARIYHVQMVERGANHVKALCVVAAHLAERLWTVLRRGTPYQLRDTDGRPITGEEGRAIIAASWRVPEEVRRRRRSRKHRKEGKVPHQVLSGHAQRARSAHTRRPSPDRILPPGPAAIKLPRRITEERTGVPS
jgi:transposase